MCCYRLKLLNEKSTNIITIKMQVSEREIYNHTKKMWIKIKEKLIYKNIGTIGVITSLMAICQSLGYIW